MTKVKIKLTANRTGELVLRKNKRNKMIMRQIFNYDIYGVYKLKYKIK